MAVYLLHFDKRYRHAGHYLGFAEDVEARIARHRAGNGARLVEVITQAGIGFTVARIWPDGDRAFERKLHNYKASPRLCPICRAAQDHVDVHIEDVDEIAY